MNGKTKAMREWKLLAFGSVITAAIANALLAKLWIVWSQSSWADCPNYAFSQTWYPEPPLSVTLLPFALAALGIIFLAARLSVLRRDASPFQLFANTIGLALNGLPFVAAFVLPALSELLQLSKSGC